VCRAEMEWACVRVLARCRSFVPRPLLLLILLPGGELSGLVKRIRGREEDQVRMRGEAGERRWVEGGGGVPTRTGSKESRMAQDGKPVGGGRRSGCGTRLNVLPRFRYGFFRSLPILLSNLIISQSRR
jgi:hypothetical protein